jgi:hypothetical protein
VPAWVEGTRWDGTVRMITDVGQCAWHLSCSNVSCIHEHERVRICGAVGRRWKIKEGPPEARA